MDTSEAAVTIDTSASTNPKNQEFPEIVTVETRTERIESSTEKKRLFKTGEPKGNALVKKVSVIERTVRTTTPYTGTV